MTLARTLSIFVLILLFFVTQVEAKKYYIYGEPKNGSKFKETIYTSDIQLRKPYKKMSDKEKSRVRTDYPDLQENDSPPFPKKGLLKIIKPYVEHFRYSGSDSIRTLNILISAAGKVVTVRGVNTNDRSFINNIWNIVDDVEFDPANCDGVPCEMDFHLELGILSLPFRR